MLDTNVNSLQTALENVTSSESDITDADFAAETANLAKSQVLLQGAMAALSYASRSQADQIKHLLDATA